MAARMSPLLLLAMLLGASATVLAGGLSGSTLGDRCARLESHGAIRGHNAGQCSVASRLSRSAVLMVRGGADELDDELDVDEEGETGADDLEGAESLENPFLGGSSAGGMGGGAGLQDLAQSLQDPQMLQEALKELQDPETQKRIKSMMEDPDFLESMKQYVEQITQDPQFEMLKKQTEKLMEDPTFVDQMTKALMSGDMGKTLADMGMAAKAEEEAEDDEE
uniref:STI1 domain-containing protein n=1 Tax=Chrysotila carterae TaxID=13221 RepID=A0A7S4BHL5_CHRCT